MHRALVLACLLPLLGACDKPRAYGEMNAIIVAAPPELWAAIADTVEEALQPRILTVTRERTFRVTYQDPAGDAWPRLRNFSQVLAIGTADDPWMAEVLEEAEEVGEPPALFEVDAVWARPQTVTAILLPPGGGREGVERFLPEVQNRLDRHFREYAEARMFMTGRDSALADTLRVEAGFSLLVPDVWDWERRDSVYVFRNDNPDPSELIRQVTIAWRSPAADPLTPEELFAWRERLAAEVFEYPQELALENRASETDTTDAGIAYLQVQAAWANPPEANWPAGGPFIARAYRCPDQDRLYLADAWLYAPGKDKYEFMLQLRTVLDSFRCGGGA